MRWRTAHKRARRPRGLTVAPYRTWDYYKRQFAWYALRDRLAAGPIYLSCLEQLRAELSAPEFRRLFDQKPTIQIVPKQRCIGRALLGRGGILFYDESAPIPAAARDLAGASG